MTAPLDTLNTPVDDTPAAEAAPTGALVKATSKGLAPVGNISMDPTQTAELLANMQDMVDRYESPLAQFTRGLERASAWGSGGTQGPAQGLALVGQQQAKEAQDIFNMRQQMAAYKSSAAQQAALTEQLGKLTGGGAGGAGYQIPPEIQAAMRLESTAEGKKKVFTDWAKENAKAMAQPDMDKPTVPVLKYDATANEWVPDMVSPRAYRSGQYRDTPQTAQALQQTAANVADPLAAIKRGVFGQESGYGSADTSKPNYAGAIGPMQILPDTFESLKKEGLIPAGYDIKNPEHNKAAGDKLLEKYYKQYGGDVDKTLAAYYGGPGAINKDGTINADWKDLRNSAAPTVGQYIAQAKQKAGLSVAPAQLATTIPPRPVSIQQAQQAQEVRMAGQKEEARITAEASRKEQEDFKASTNPNLLPNQAALADRFGKVLDKIGQSDKVVSLLNAPKMSNAIATLIRDGIQTPVGSVGMSNLEDALQLAIPGVTPAEIEARREIKQIMSQYALEASKMAQGQGSMSDYERRMFMDIAGSTTNTVDMLRRTQQALKARANFNQAQRDLYDDMYKPGQQRDFQAFLASKEYRDLAKNYRNELLKINEGLTPKEGAQKGTTVPTTGTTSGGVKWKVVQ